MTVFWIVVSVSNELDTAFTAIITQLNIIHGVDDSPKD